MADGLLTIFIVLVVIIIVFRSRSKTSHAIRRAELAKREGRTLQAADLFIKAKRLAQAARIALGLPEAARDGILRKISEVVSPSKKKILFTKLGDEYAVAEDFVKAATAYELAGNALRAARYYVLADLGLVQRGIRLVNGFTRSQGLDNEKELRNLARFAFQHEKYFETAEILEFLGARDEANAVLVYAGEEFQKSEQVEGAIEAYARIGMDSEAVALSLKFAQQMLEMNQLEKALHYFKRASVLAKELEMTQEQEQAEKAMLATSRLVGARKHLKQNKYRVAADLYEKALAEFSGAFSEPLLAEAALAHEKSGNYERASLLYAEAARRTSKKQLTERFRKKARALKAKPAVKLLPSKEEEQRCIICRRIFKSTDKVVRCPYCHVAAHYAHFAEWIKINGKCPVCKRRLKRVELVQ